MEIKRLADYPQVAQEAAGWFSRKWGIPEEAYLESIAKSVRNPDAVPQWYIVCGGDAGEGGMGAERLMPHRSHPLALFSRYSVIRRAT